MNRAWLHVGAGCLCAIGLFAGCTTGDRGRTPTPGDKELQFAASGGRAAFESGAVAAAVELYGVALKRARLCDDRGEIARNAYNLAVCWAAINRWAEAQSAITEARRECGDDRYLSGQIELVAAKIAWRQNDARGARKALELARSELGSKPPPLLMAQIHLLAGALDCDAGVLEQARREWAAASTLTDKSKDLRILAELDDLDARLWLRSGKPGLAATVFDREADRLRLLGQHAAMADALQAAGDAYEKAGQDAAAADRLYRAGRSCWSGGDRATATALLLRSAATARRGGAEELALQAEMLLQEK